MNILVIGAGYVGLITALGFAKLGNKVNVIDLNKDIIKELNDSRPTFFEPELEELLKDKNLDVSFFDNYEDGMSENIEFVFVCVQTPSNNLGQVNTTYVKNVLCQLKLYNHDFTVCIKSTIQSKIIESICHEEEIDYKNIIFNPEFLREGSAIYDFFHPDRIVIGGSNSVGVERCKSLYKDFECEILVTDSVSSQIIKYLSNVYLALRLSYVNEAYRLTSDLGGNPNTTLKGVGLDNRIGLDYFRPSPGWGGSCFPKDVNEIVNTYANEFSIPIMSKIIESNEEQQKWVAEKLFQIAISNDKENIVLIRAPFKENTDDLRDSPTIKVYEILNKYDIDVFIFEDEIDMPNNFKVIKNIDEIIDNALYVQIFPENSSKRIELLSKISNLEKSIVWQMWDKN